MTESVLAFDFALNCGVAAWRVGEPKPYVSLLQFKNTEEPGLRFAKFYKYILKITKEREVTDIAFETPIVGGGTRDKNFWLIGAYGIACMAGAQLKIRVTAIDNRAFFLHWCGDNSIEGDRRKTMSILEAQRRGFPNIRQHDMADALGVLSLRCSMLRLAPPWDFKQSPGPLFTNLSTGTNQPQGTKISKSNERAAAIITNRALSFERDNP